jgi:hypothetical protein
MTPTTVVRLTVTAAVATALILLVHGVSSYVSTTMRFPRAMQVRSALEYARNSPAWLPLLDIYELELQEQAQWSFISGVDYTDQRIAIYLQRFVAHLAANEPELAEQALATAAHLRYGRTASSDEIEVERRVARKLYSSAVE